jgi:hypothetical protein
MLEENGAHVGVYRVLDEVLNGTGVPPGTKGAMFSIIDQLRTKAVPLDQVRRAEQISLEIHKLESALRGSDKSAAMRARTELRTLAAAWIEQRVFEHHN